MKFYDKGLYIPSFQQLIHNKPLIEDMEEGIKILELEIKQLKLILEREELKGKLPVEGLNIRHTVDPNQPITY